MWSSNVVSSHVLRVVFLYGSVATCGRQLFGDFIILTLWVLIIVELGAHNSMFEILSGIIYSYNLLFCKIVTIEKLKI